MNWENYSPYGPAVKKVGREKKVFFFLEQLNGSEEAKYNVVQMYAVLTL